MADLQDYFRNASPYCVTRQQVPDCFTALERHLGPSVPSGYHPAVNRSVLLAQNLCQRMGDVDYYAERIQDEVDNIRRGSASVIASLLVGHFSVCKSVLDAAAIALTDLYGLLNQQGRPLTAKQQDFGKGVFINALGNQQVAVAKRYFRFHSIVTQIVDWRDRCMHRAAPLVVIAMSRDPATGIASISGFKFHDGSDIDYNRLLGKALANKSHDVLHFHNSWRPQLVQLREEVCSDIRANSQ